MTTTARSARLDAADHIDAEIVGDAIVYYAAETGRWYVGPADDLDYLAQLRADTDTDVARDAYSHWCAGTSHADYATQDEALAAAATTREG